MTIYKLSKEVTLESFQDSTLVDGAFDPIHDGHITYFNEARALGNRVVCLIAPDNYTLKKHPIFLPSAKRATIIDALKMIDSVILSDLETEESIELIAPKVFFKGKDWENKLPKNIIETCKKLKIEIKYGKTTLNSSTTILERYYEQSRQLK